jgi:hypothetical protein
MSKTLPSHYTDSKGQKVEIASMHYAHLVSAHAKLLRTEERKHETAVNSGYEYDNPEADAEIDAMKAEIDRRDAARAEEEAPR